MAAILAVLFVGDDIEENPTVSLTVVPTSTPQSTTTPPNSASTSFQAREDLNGRWQSVTGDTVVQFGGTNIDTLRSVIEIDGESAELVLVEPSQVSTQPSVNQPVQAVMFVTIETETVRSALTPVLVEFLKTDDGLLMEITFDGSVQEYALLPV